jgi:hypothetical protein
MPGEPTPRPSDAGIIGQTRHGHGQRPNDPRERRAAALRSTNQVAGAYVQIDQNGRVSLDFEALYSAIKARLEAES